MYKRVASRTAIVVAALLLAAPGVALASKGGHSGSAKACPTHKHSGHHNGSTKGHKNGSGKGKKCRGAAASGTINNSNRLTSTYPTGTTTTGDDDQGTTGDDQGDTGDDQGTTGDDQGDDNDDQGDTGSTTTTGD